MSLVFAFALVHAVTVFEGAPVHTLTAPKGTPVTPATRRLGRTVSGFAVAQKAQAGINGGYFNHSDGYPVSHVTVQGRALGKPTSNQALTTNPKLIPFLATIFDERSAWFQGPRGWAIAPWSHPPTGYTDALQAGPALLPRPQLEAEAFITRDRRGTILRDGIASTSRAARSGLGLKADGSMVWAVVGMPGLSIAGLSRALKMLGCTSALALDGGSSSTLVWTENGRQHVFTGSGQGEALVNSVLLIR